LEVDFKSRNIGFLVSLFLFNRNQSFNKNKSNEEYAIRYCAIPNVSKLQNRQISEQPLQFSGIYPHLAYYNNESECGTGAVVPWAGRLWVITYGPHLPLGSSDKLYEITTDLQLIVREESIGGTPANRMIHNESNQLFIGPYAIDADRNVRAIPYELMPGRHTGNAVIFSILPEKFIMEPWKKAFMRWT
jgi:hypothetical protein